MQVGGKLVFGLTGAELIGWLTASVNVFEECQELLNQANVFPVPDADTGTNMLLTLRGALDRAQHAGPQDPAQILVQAALGALTHARGNSGIILAEYIRGLARSVNKNLRSSASAQLRSALREASDRAYSAVAQPVEGTILTAAKAAAHGAQVVGDSSGISEVLDSALEHATTALERSHLDLAVLARAGVLDAGAYGLILFLTALRAVATDLPVTHRAALLTGAAAPALELDGGVSADGEFEVMCLVSLDQGEDISDESAELFTHALRQALAALGESVVVIGGAQGDAGALWSVHVHTDTPDLALVAIEREAPGPIVLSQIVVRNLVRQISVDQSAKSEGQRPIKLVVCTSGPQLALDLARAGAIVCVERGQALGVDDIERALTEVHHDSGNAESDAIVVSNNPVLTGALRDGQYSLGLISAADDAQVVAVTSALLAQWDAHGDLSVDQITAVGRSCVESLDTYRVQDANRVSLTPLMDHLRGTGPTIPAIVTILLDDQCPPHVITDLTDGIERLNNDSEVIVLASGRLGSGLTASVEWLED